MNRFLQAVVLVCGGFVSIGVSAAEVTTETVDYEHDGVALRAFVVTPAGVEGPRPGVLVCHAWWGQGDYARRRATMLAELGYTAVALDMYGKGVLVDNPGEAGLAVLKARPNVDPDRLAAIGYCFGGTTVMELALSGADLAGVVSFHGSLMEPQPIGDGGAAGTEAQHVKAKVLIAHGQADPFYGNDQLLTVIDALQAAEVDTTTVFYSGAVHAFTDPSATGELAGAEYDASADARSWQHMRVFFDELFSEAD